MKDLYSNIHTNLDKERFNKIVEYTRKYPELPVIPIIHSDVVDEEYRYYLGEWGNVEIDEFVKKGNTYFLRSVSDIDELFYAFYTEEEVGITKDISNEKAFKIMKKFVNKLNWEKAIFVYINEREN